MARVQSSTRTWYCETETGSFKKRMRIDPSKDTFLTAIALFNPIISARAVTGRLTTKQGTLVVGAWQHPKAAKRAPHQPPQHGRDPATNAVGAKSSSSSSSSSSNVAHPKS
jgi:hypothetical protein